MTPYELLKVSPEATPTELRAAYRRACMQHHPDRGGSPETFHAIQLAYRALNRRGCPECNNKGFITTRTGLFAKRIPCPNCWRHSR